MSTRLMHLHLINNIRNITGSYVLLYRAVYNLVENAIKYNRPNGSVTVSVKEKNGQAMILVKDTGIGISPENQKKIFDPFFRVDKSRSRAMGGADWGWRWLTLLPGNTVAQ